jgi:hypothetical protein
MQFNLQKLNFRIKMMVFFKRIGRSQSAVRDAYLELEGEAAKHFEVVKEFVYL